MLSFLDFTKAFYFINVLLAFSHSSVGIFRCDFTRALFLATCAMMCLTGCLEWFFLLNLAFLRVFASHFNNVNHHSVLTTIASLTLLQLTQGRSARDHSQLIQRSHWKISDNMRLAFARTLYRGKGANSMSITTMNNFMSLLKIAYPSSYQQKKSAIGPKRKARLKSS